MANLVPVDHNPFEGDEAAMMPETFVNPAVKATIEHLATGAKHLAETPGAIAKPNPYPAGSEEALWYDTQRQNAGVSWAPEMALTMLGGGAAGVEGAAGEAALGSGPARMRMIENADLYKELANQNRAKGYATGKSAEGWDFKRPDQTKGSFQQAAQEARAKFAADAHQAQLDYSHTAPGNPLMSPDDWAFIDENIRKGNPTLGSGATDKKTAATIQAIRGELDMSPEARAMRAKEQGYTIDAYKGGQPYDWKTMPETNGKGEVIPGTENRVPQELTSLNSPNAPYAGFFSNTPAVADRFAAPFEHGAVWPTKLKFENPLVIDAEGKHAAAFQFDTIAQRNGTTDKMNQFKEAFAEGSPHDGVILKNTKDEGDVYIPRDADQVRSRFAAFDPANKGSGKLLGSGATDKKLAAGIQAIRGLDMAPEARMARAQEQGFQGPWYHGGLRMDRFTESGKINPKRATSGPMPYFTDDPEMASAYAMGKKPDTSLQMGDTGNVADYFTVSPKDLGLGGRTPMSVEQSWHFLPPEVKQDILNKATRVGHADIDMAEGPLTLHPEGVNATGAGKDHWDYIMKREARGNPLAALRDLWHDSGRFVDDPGQLNEVYRLAGYPHPISEVNAPWTEARGVFPGMLRMQNPLDTTNAALLRDNILPSLEEAFKRDRSRTQEYGVDLWDKNHRYTPKEWVAQAKEDLAKGENSYVWTSIPDKVTAELRKLGYDGILDTGGKMGGKGHTVAIPFGPEQVRSQFAAFDPKNIGKSKLLGSGATDQKAAATIQLLNAIRGQGG